MHPVACTLFIFLAYTSSAACAHAHNSIPTSLPSLLHGLGQRSAAFSAGQSCRRGAEQAVRAGSAGPQAPGWREGGREAGLALAPAGGR